VMDELALYGLIGLRQSPARGSLPRAPLK
jgi:hypothetical protein